MPTLVIDNVPATLYDRIESFARSRKRTTADTVLEVLEQAFQVVTRVEPPLPAPPFLTEEIPAPFDLPLPPGTPVVPVDIHDYVPEPHDLPDME